MAKSNRDKVSETLDTLKDGLKPFVERELKNKYGDGWKAKATGDLRFDPGEDWDASALLSIMWNHWNLVFREVLSHADRSLVAELRDVRNSWAHQKSFSSDDTYRAMDSMERLLEAVSAGENALQINQQKMEVMRLKLSEQTRADARRRASQATEGTPSRGLTAWREIVEPHADVTSGSYQQAEFAANLYEVATSRARPEYGEPAEFFRRTYLTEGLRDLLTTAVRRLTANEGDPVVALQTNFGGGKTHSMLALYHLFSGYAGSDLPNVDELLASLDVGELPSVKRAVLVGQFISPGETHTMADGTVARTLWGELAWQLGGKAGYELVRDADESSTNPGKRLIELFDMAGPCLILIDEWVSYARQLYEKHDLPAGSFDTQFTFAQALTEAAATSPNTMLVVSVPSSDIEVGGTAGKEALNRLENVVSRKEATWQPASTEEGFEIVRRRLFKTIVGEDVFRERDNVIRAFLETYRDNGREFPPEVSSAEYEKRMKSAYPIHPDVFDRLYTEWSTLDRFQRTRGVLRLMAAVIHELWEKEDRNLLILPGMIPMEESSVRKELTRYLEPAWPAVVEADVDGPESTPLSIDRENNNLGRYSATRRVARTVFLGTAPLQGTANRGKDIRQINLGCIQPGESLATFGDALRRLQNRATYLNTDGERTYYDTAQNINRDAESRKAGFSDEDVRHQIRQVLKKQERNRADFSRIHACPPTPSDVSDDREVRLVILGPETEHLSGDDDTPAIKAAREFLDSRGAAPRIYRNTLVFLAPDRTRLVELEDAVRWSMAWSDIDKKKEELDLNQSQIRTVGAKRKEWADTVEQRVPEAYSWLIVPVQKDKHAPVTWSAFRLKGDGDLAQRATRKLDTEQLLSSVYASSLLRRELDGIPLWRGDHVSVKQLCEDLAQYLYLPRLTSERVLLNAIGDGVASLTWQDDTFAYAESFDKDRGRYTGLRANAQINILADGESLVVKPDVAIRQIEADAARSKAVASNSAATTPPPASTQVGSGTQQDESDKQIADAKPRRFYGSVDLDATRLGRDAGRIAQEILSHLAGLPAASSEITLEIQVDVPDGIPDHVVRTVTENCRTLKFKTQGFEGR